MDFHKIDCWLEEHYCEMEETLCDSLRIPSVKGEKEEGMPFGRAINDALLQMRSLCAEMGMETENQDGYVVTADIPGKGNGQVGVLAHLDVVPAEAAQWTTPPFAPDIRNGNIYARGAVDDKGPAFAALFAGKALVENGFVPEKTIRYIFGGDEESGCGCVLHYTAHNPPPDCGFTPDGSFPAIVGEKGGAMFTLRRTWAAADVSEPLQLQSLRAGTAINVIPERAEAVFLCGGELPEFPEADGIVTAYDGEKLNITAKGSGGHASTPWEGDNALVRLLSYLDKLTFSPAEAKNYVSRLCILFEDPCYGAGLGVLSEDAFGKLTCVPSMMELDGTHGALSCDMRTPVTRSPRSCFSLIEQTARENGMALEGWDDYPELYVPQDSALVQTLMRVYRGVTGDMSEPLIIGGGTYAKHFKNFVAFGPQRQDEPEVAHQADEFISREKLLELTKIYARAIYELAK